MQQYDQSGPAPTQFQSTSEHKIEEVIERLQSHVAQQDVLIENLQKEIRRLKDKLDGHADHINRLNRG